MRVALCALALGTGCGRIDFDAVGGLAPPAVPEFQAPTIITELDSPAGADDDPTLRQDQLEIFWATYRNAALDENVYRSVRASVGDPWGMPTIVTEVNSAIDNGSPELSFDGLTLYTSTNAMGSGDIYVSTRATLTSAFSPPQLLPSTVNTAVEEFSGAPSEDGRELFFHHIDSGSPGTGTGELWVATRASASDPWGDGHRIEELADGYDARNPFVTANGLVLYYASRSPLGNPSGMQTQIFRATRVARTAAWTPGEPVETLRDVGSPLEDPWLPEDQSCIYFSDGGALYIALAQ